mmetsp:Transcript_29592/g.90786  ORF Transcript_29592/g.90786 Transcript_29592/m.90786 type:complete len:215 (+) Transcript_29592:324-968(+)
MECPISDSRAPDMIYVSSSSRVSSTTLAGRLRSPANRGGPGAPPSCSILRKTSTRVLAPRAPDGSCHLPPRISVGIPLIPRLASRRWAASISSLPSLDSINERAALGSAPTFSAAFTSMSTSLSFCPASKWRMFRSAYMLSAALIPKVRVTHCTMRCEASVLEAIRSRLKCSIPTSRPRSLSVCLAFCASQPSFPPHLRSSRVRFVSSNAGSVG